MCCLKYEHPLYQDFRTDAPPAGAHVTTLAGPGTVAGHHVPSGTVAVKLAADGTACAGPKASVCGPRQPCEAACRQNIKSPRGQVTRSRPVRWPGVPAVERPCLAD
jgi:cell fate regulator YaaT (PSP1 superfamily)